MRKAGAERVNLGGAFATPLRYPGGKGRLGPWLGRVLHHNRLQGGWYLEPYAGGAGSALYLLMERHVGHIVINDADPVVYAFWKSATEESARFVRRIRETPVTLQSWYQQKGILEDPRRFDPLEVGFATFFLNRTNRSGILSAGVIGGKSQAGKWKLDARFNKDVLCQRIERIGALADCITVLCLDALDLLTGVAPGLPKECLVYLDPPYYVKGSLLYRNHYNEGDHSAVAKYVIAATHPVIVTYDNCPEVQRLYKNLDRAQFSLHYSTHSSRPYSDELMFYKNLELPSEPELTRGFRI